MNKKIPFLDLITPHTELQDELIAVFREVIKTGRFVGGHMVDNFERDFAEFCGTSHCAGVASGTDAVRFALMAAGVKPGETILTVPNTFIATTEAITQAGCVPEFMEIDEKTYNIDTSLLAEYLELSCDKDSETGMPVSRRNGKVISAIVPVHLYGQPADMDEVCSIAEKYNLIVVEDACQAHGAEYYSNRHNAWINAGALGHAAAFSFYPGKNLGAMGEGGAVTTNNPEIDVKIRKLRDHGQAKKYIHDMEGYNGRLDALQAGILAVKLKRLMQWNEQRIQAAYRYNKALMSVPELITPFEKELVKTVYHLYVIRVADRNALQKMLSEQNIWTALHYPVPLHLQKPYTNLGYHKGDFPVAEKVADEILSLPMYPGLTEEDVLSVSDAIKNIFHAGMKINP